MGAYYYRHSSNPVNEMYCSDNTSHEVLKSLTKVGDPDVIYADCIYENDDLGWIYPYWAKLNTNGLFIVQTDHHTIHKYWSAFDLMPEATFVNHIVWKNEWGNHPKNRMHQCFDDILVFCRGKEWKFFPDNIQVPKATASTKLNPSGRQTKTATAFWSDICLTTTSKERIKLDNGKLIPWQKPLALYDRLFSAYTEEGDYIVDPFMGSGTCAVWCFNNNRDYTGIESYNNVYDIAVNRVKQCTKLE